MVLDNIINQRKNSNTVSIYHQTFTTKIGIIRNITTALGWELSVLWKDGIRNWVSLKDIKDSPTALKYYSKSKNIEN